MIKSIKHHSGNIYVLVSIEDGIKRKLYVSKQDADLMIQALIDKNRKHKPYKFKELEGMK